MSITVTTCSCERTFSKLYIVKTKLRNSISVGQPFEYFIGHKEATYVNLDKLIESFKILRQTVDMRMEHK